MVKNFVTIVILCWIIFNAVTISTGAIRPHNLCTTPNGETASCIPLTSCPVIHNAIRTKNKAAIQFAHDSQCDQQGNTLFVCCGTVGYYQNDNFEYIINPYPPKDKIKPFARTKRDTEDEEYIRSLFRAPTQETQTKSLKRSINNGSSEDNVLVLKDFDSNILPDRSICGLHSGDDRIIGGEQTGYDEYPWMVALEYAQKKTGQLKGVKCGGSVVNKRFVLTAAHCTASSEFELVQVRLGEWDLTSDPDCPYCDRVTFVKINKTIPHPLYNKVSKQHDIALLKLERDIEYTDFIRPICLPPENLPSPKEGADLMVAGWGLTENRAVSDVKLKVNVPIISNRECARIIKNVRIGVNQLCAGGVSGKDACNGDSGGPLIRSFIDKNNGPQWYQEGIVSHGVDCGVGGYPGIYTRINRYINWILHTIEIS